MNMETVHELVIIGGGCAGLTAAIYAARAKLDFVVLQGSLPGGLLTQTTEVENFPGFPESIQGAELMDRMYQQAKQFGARFLIDSATSVRPENKGYTLTLASDQFLKTQALIFATGSHPKSLGLPQEKELLGGKGLSVCATCDGFFYRNEVVCVIGGGDSACEEAIFLSKLCKKVYLIHRRNSLRASKIMADRVINNPKIEIVWSHVPVDFSIDSQGFIEALKVRNVSINENRSLACKGVFLAIGWQPNTEHFKDFLTLDAQGYIQTLNGSVCTNQPGVFAAGDCVDARYRQACVAAGMGAQAALEAEKWLMENE